ncbi:hypothetical protein OHA25_60075 (plasmid) [Nonomuraea sp. NBC_00507]|uniref:hypothetical protein n=1 Tax=Nonomuraea sp. NBC_00507 TaxID=2976002 RepID=UPI002E18773C
MLRLMTAWYLRWLLKPVLEAGATVADVLHALDVREDDSRWTYTWLSTAEIRHPAGWVRHRLSAWIGPDGRVLPLPSQRRAAAEVRRRAAQQAPAWSHAVLAAEKGLKPPELEPRMSPAEATAPAPRAGEAALDRDDMSHTRGAALARMLLEKRGLPTINRLKLSRRDDWREELERRRRFAEASAQRR